MKKVLAIPGIFVPSNDTVTLLSYKQLRQLDAEIDVIALESDVDKSLDEKLKRDSFFSKFHILNVGKYHDAWFSIRNVNLIKALINVKRYQNKAVKYFEDGNYQSIYTSLFPVFTTSAGLRIKKKYPKVQWIASISDPINNSPYKYNDKDTFKHYSLIEKIAFLVYCHFYVNDKDEINILENADKIIFICEEERDFVIEQYLKKRTLFTREQLLMKSEIVPLNYVKEWDVALTQNIAKTNNKKLILSHFGRVYGLRNIDNFIIALYELNQEKKISPDLFVIVQYSQFKKKNRNQIKKLKLEAYFEFKDKIPYEKCLEEMAASDVLLIFDTILDENEWQPYLPSKVIEYSLLRKPVFALTTSKSPIYRIMSKNKGLCACDNVNDIKGKFMEIFDGKAKAIEYATENSDIKDKMNRIFGI